MTSIDRLPFLPRLSLALGGAAADVALAIRLARRNPFYSSIAIATLGLGLGCATTALTIAYAAVITPLPYRDSSALVRLQIDAVIDGRTVRADPSLDQMQAWLEAGTFSDLGASRTTSSVIITDGEPFLNQVNETWAMTPSYLRLLGISPAVGRTFGAGDTRADAPQVAMIGHRFFARNFNADPTVIGRVLHVRDRSKNIDDAITIVGVLPAAYLPEAVLVVPIKQSDGYHEVVGRLQPGVSIATAQARLSSAAAPGPSGPVRLSALEAQTDNERNPSRLRLLIGAAAAVLVLACVNVAALGLASGLSRRNELATRVALGAMRTRLIRQLLTEHVVLAVLASVVGFAINAVLLNWIMSHIEGLTSQRSTTAVNPGVMLLVMALVLVVGVLVGSWTAVRSSGRLTPTNSRGWMPVRSSVTRRGGRAMLIAQSSITMVALAGTGLLVRSYEQMVSSDPGFNVDRCLALRVAPVDDANRLIVEQDYLTLLAALRDLPDVSAVGLTNAFRTSAVIQASLETGDTLNVSTKQITPGVLEALGLTVEAGVLPSDRDVALCPDCTILSAAAARRAFGAEPAVGKSLRIAGKERRVLAVVSDVNFSAPYPSRAPEIYVFSRNENPLFMTVIIGTRGPARSVAAQARSLATRLGPRAVVDSLRTGAGLLDDRIVWERQKATLAGLAGILCLVISSVGVLAVTSFVVARRLPEMGIRLALGATPGAVIRGVIRSTMLSVASGLALGATVALLATRALTSLLFGITPADPATYAVAGTTFLSCACAAAYLGARCAGKVDPLTILKSE